MVKDLNLCIDEEGVIRSKGRINKNITHEEGVQNHILLGKSHHLTYLLIILFHHRVKHLGVGTTLNALRLGGFWVPKGRQVIKKVLSYCMICRKMNELPFKYPKVTNLPEHRVNLIVPYRHTGVDSRVVKNCIRKTVGRAKIEYFDMLTLLCDVENAVSSRPLTYQTSESDLEVTTPNSFIYPNSTSNLLLRTEGENPTLPEVWNNAYLLSLRESTKISYEHRFENKIVADDIVLIHHPQKSRPFWLLGRVVEVFKGDDNKIRSANVKRDGSIQNYSINHLYPLELQQLTNESILPCNNVNETPPVGHLPVETVRRSARLMAQRAKSQ